MKKLRIKDKKRKKKVIIFALLSAIVFTLLMGVSYRFYRLVSDTVWDGKNRINLVFQAKPVFITSFSPEEDSLKTLVIPEGTLIKVVYGYGFYRAESIYQLGELESQGGRLLSGSLQEYLGLPIDGYVRVDNLEFPTQDSGELRLSLIKAMKELFRGRGRTNLTRWDLFRLWWNMNRLKAKEVTLVDLKGTNALSLVILPDESQAVEVDLERFDRIVQPLFTDEKIRSESLAIVVLNGTSHPGLARWGSRLISNIGGRVIGVGERETARLPARQGDDSSAGEAEKCEVRSKEENKNSYTVEKIIKLFDCQWGGENLEEQRADVMVILGENYWQRFTPHHSGARLTR